ncbi:MAG: tripartite tricarboxylate transporter TctB family protein [Spirochaetales bacterium]|nr:tripartite tricarboxylate transporter TctB family protein [Spirochaetales bacterium]
MNDCVIGIALLGVGIFIVQYKSIVKGQISDSAGGYLVRPDVYVRMIGVLLIICSLILVVKSINFRRSAETRGFHFVVTKEVALTGLSLLLYAALLEPVGFNITTFLLTLFLTCMYMRKEKMGEGNPPITRRVVIRSLIVATIYSVAMVIIVYLIFAKALNVILP